MIKNKRTDSLHKTLEEKYGDPNYGLFGSDNYKQKMIQKYGNPYFSNHEKARRTMKERYYVIIKEYN